MKCYKEFTFVDNCNDLSITIEEVVQGDYGLYVWPSAPALAQYVWYNRSELLDKRVIEIGAGTSLPGIVAAKCGAAEVILTDSELLTEALQSCTANARLNHVENITVMGITWGQISPQVLHLPKIDIILGSDCFYDTKDFEDVLVTVETIMLTNPFCKFWTTYQQRRTIEHLLRKWDLKCRLIPLQCFQAAGNRIAGYHMHTAHTIEMLEIVKIDEENSA